MTGPTSAALSRFEHAPLAVFPTSAEASTSVAREIAALIRSRQAANRTAVLGLATGSTPLGLYAELVRMHREEGLSFANVVTFNLDEYFPLPASNPRSYRSFMQAHLFDHVDIPAPNTNVPDGSVALSSVDAHCRDYEEPNPRRRRHRFPGPGNRPHRAHRLQRARQPAALAHADR